MSRPEPGLDMADTSAVSAPYEHKAAAAGITYDEQLSVDQVNLALGWNF